MEIKTSAREEQVSPPRQPRGTRPYVAPTLEILDVSGTRGGKAPSVVEVTVFSGS